jgi:hypothetical protein
MDTGRMNEFEVKDSGERTQFESGMVRDVTEGKTRYDLVFDGPMFERWAEHLTKGAVKYEPRNWMKASGEAELERFRESAVRHFMQWLQGDRSEDHAAAVLFNINGVEYVGDRMEARERLAALRAANEARVPFQGEFGPIDLSDPDDIGGVPA